MNTGWLQLAGAVLWLAGLATGRWSRRAWLASTLAGAGCLLAAALATLVAGGAAGWRLPFALAGAPVHLRCDALSAWFLALVAVIGAAGALYASGYWTDRRHPQSAPAGRGWWSLLLLCLQLVLLAADGLHFLLGWELFTLAAYFLITLDRGRLEVRRAGWLYLGASHAAVLALFAFFALLAGERGGWELGPTATAPAALFWLALFGFGLKAGLFPLHVWLPAAHANAPSHVSALLSGVTIKLGIYGLLRATTWVPVPAAAGGVVVALGIASAVLGVAFALGQHDLKRLLAYHSVENIGIILLGLGFALIAVAQGDAAWGRLAFAGGLLHVWNHGLFKALLFLGAGSVLHATGTREMSRLGGLWRAMPWTASLFGLGAVAISGLPPLNGFVSEWLVYLGLFDAAAARGPSAWAALPAAIALAATGALALACFAKVCGIVFLGAPRSPAVARAHESGPAMRGPMVLLAAVCTGLGLAPVLLAGPLQRVTEAWHPAWAGAPLDAPLGRLTLLHAAFAGLAAAAAALLWRRLRRAAPRAVTWDCGYAAPTARMQYTAGSFAGLLTGWFAWILRPAVHDRPPAPESIHPDAAARSSHTPETVLDHLVAPVGRAALAVSGAVRRLQHGRIQAYILYLVAGLAALAALAFLGGGN